MRDFDWSGSSSQNFVAGGHMRGEWRLENASPAPEHGRTTLSLPTSGLTFPLSIHRRFRASGCVKVLVSKLPNCHDWWHRAAAPPTR